MENFTTSCSNGCNCETSPDTELGTALVNSGIYHNSSVITKHERATSDFDKAWFKKIKVIKNKQTSTGIKSVLVSIGLRPSQK